MYIPDSSAHIKSVIRTHRTIILNVSTSSLVGTALVKWSRVPEEISRVSANGTTA